MIGDIDFKSDYELDRLPKWRHHYLNLITGGLSRTSWTWITLNDYIYQVIIEYSLYWSVSYFENWNCFNDTKWIPLIDWSVWIDNWFLKSVGHFYKNRFSWLFNRLSVFNSRPRSSLDLVHCDSLQNLFFCITLIRKYKEPLFNK